MSHGSHAGRDKKKAPGKSWNQRGKAGAKRNNKKKRGRR